jgi:hypothetical protein
MYLKQPFANNSVLTIVCTTILQHGWCYTKNEEYKSTRVENVFEIVFILFLVQRYFLGLYI